MAQMDITPIGTADEVSALPLQSNYVEIVNKYNAHDIATTDVHGITSPDVILSKQDIDALIDKYYPISSFMQIWDNNIDAVKSLIDTNKYIKLTGQLLGEEWSSSPYYEVFATTNLPDLDQAYFIGTTDTPSITVAGVNVVNLNHFHTITHKHSVATHTHTEEHGHNLYADGGYSYAHIYNEGTTGAGYIYTRHEYGSSWIATTSFRNPNSGTAPSSYEQAKGVAVKGTIPDKETTSNTGTTVSGYTENNTETNSTSLLSATQDIRPKTIKCSTYLRIL